MAFDPNGYLLATGSMDGTAKIWDVESGQEIYTLKGHTAEIISLQFNSDGDSVLTGSFDETAKIWDVNTGECVHTLVGHSSELS